MKVSTICKTTLLTALFAFTWGLSGDNAALAFDFHTDTAHGNNAYGVNRIGAGYDIGDCAHCHDTFDEAICGNPLMLFSTPLYSLQNTGFCLECHKSPDNSAQDTMPNQFSYGAKFGGGTDTCPGHIRQAVNFVKENGNSRPGVCGSDNGSAHHLTSMRNFLQGQWGFSDSNDEINPCEGCHNPHKAQQHDYPVGAMGTSPISLPSTHEGTWDIWGAAADERMDTYLTGNEVYMAPYYYNGGGKHEPDNSWTNDGSNLPDYVTFCTDCHNSSTAIYSEELDRDLYQFDWTVEKHGGGVASNNLNYYDLKNPYSDTQSGMYVLSCTDCHEPHGSPNSFLTRKWVNGNAASLIEGSVNDWRNWCRRCHNQMSHLPDTGPHDAALGCTTCHPVIEDPPGVGYNCYSPSLGCHRHGSGLGGL